MKAIEIIFSLCLFVAYKFLFYIDWFINFISPVRLLSKSKFIRVALEEKGIDSDNPFKELDTINNNKKYGVNITISMTIVSIMSFLTVNLLIVGLATLFNYPSLNIFYLMLFLFVAFYLIPNKLVFNDYKYLKYFRRYEKWSNFKLLFYILISILFSISVIVFSFVVISYYMKNCY